MEDIKDLIDEIPDVELQEPRYEVWVLGYGSDGNITDYEVFIADYEDPEDAIKRAKKVVEEEYRTLTPPEGVAHLVIQVETVVEVEEDETENIGTIYEDSVSI